VLDLVEAHLLSKDTTRCLKLMIPTSVPHENMSRDDVVDKDEEK
jgi:hypothetical protein